MNMTNLIAQGLFSILRHLLTGLGAWLIAQGFVQEGKWEQLLMGASVFLVGIIWSIINKSGFVKRIETALGMQSGATTEQLEQVVKQQ